MSKVNLSNIVKSVRVGAKKHSPEILTGLGIAGMVSTTVMAVTATPKALVLIEEEKRRQNHDILEEAKINGDDCKPITKLHPKDVVRVTWKCYIPAAATCAVSIFCLVGASSVNARRNAALATAYSLSESAIKEYRDKVIETIGEKKEKTVRDAVAKEKVEKNPVSNSEVIITEKGNTLCYDSLSGRYFKSDIDKIKQGLNEANKDLLNQSYLSLNDFYYCLGLSNADIGFYIGWNIAQGLIELDYSSQIAEDGNPCLVIDFVNRPKYDYDKWM